MIALAGGKGANLGELSRIEGVKVPDGFCISTEVYNRVTEGASTFKGLLDCISLLRAEDREKISQLGGEIRKAVQGLTIPEDIREEIIHFLKSHGENDAYAVRSSATAEDLPDASFAGQQDTFLNVIGKESILEHVFLCWASLFTDRAIIYRIQNGFDHRKVRLSVVVQKMIFPQVAGIMFTADPVTSNRKILSIDASFGLGEAIVSGLVNADNYKVRNGSIINRRVGAKKLAVFALQGGGTEEQEVEPARQNSPALTDEQILRLELTGRKIEQHFGCPQDIEWCLADGIFYVVQSRPITALYPIPEANDYENHVYISVGHQQMMTDALKPLGLSLRQLTAMRPMYVAGGRQFVDVAQQLSSATARENLLTAMEQHDPLMKDALVSILERGDFIKPLPGDGQKQNSGRGVKGTPAKGTQPAMESDPAIVADLIHRNETSLEVLKKNIHGKSGVELFDFILGDIQELKNILSDPRVMRAIMTGMNASAWINEKMFEWLGEKNVADTLSQSVPNNITSEMGLALLDVADAIRPYPEVTAYLKQVNEDSFLDELPRIKGGREAQSAIRAYLDKYGMRCAGEIDITKARWSEKPSTLIPLILSNIKNFESRAGKRKFEEGLQQAMEKERELLQRLRQLPDGEQKAEETKRMTDLLRNFIGYREYPKYGIVSRFFVYKQAILKEAERLVQARVIQDKEDVYYLTFEELQETVRSHKLDPGLIGKRKDLHRMYEKLHPPRVITSEGEIVTGHYKRGNIPDRALAGLAVSSGIVVGRARVILNMEDAELEDGDILVTTFTDPSWTPLFVSVKGLVTEVGGLMTHGAVIAREYGLPAVIGVENATSLIKDRQKVRLNGTDGWVEILD